MLSYKRWWIILSYLMTVILSDTCKMQLKMCNVSNISLGTACFCDKRVSQCDLNAMYF